MIVQYDFLLQPERREKKSHCFKHNRFYSISFNLSNVDEISGVESERTVSKFAKRKRNFLHCIHLLHKAGALN